MQKTECALYDSLDRTRVGPQPNQLVDDPSITSAVPFELPDHRDSVCVDHEVYTFEAQHTSVNDPPEDQGTPFPSAQFALRPHSAATLIAPQ
jgi:hypothetical protein